MEVGGRVHEAARRLSSVCSIKKAPVIRYRHYSEGYAEKDVTIADETPSPSDELPQKHCPKLFAPLSGLIVSEKRKLDKIRASTVIKGIIARLLFLSHTLIVVNTAIMAAPDKRIGFLIVLGLFILLIVSETIVSYSLRQFSQWKWICPSVLLYTITTIPLIWIMELSILKERTMMGRERCMAFFGDRSFTATPPWLNDTDISLAGNQSSSSVNISTREMTTIHQQTMVFLLLLGRWLLPKDQFSRLELAQLLLVFIGSGEDIVEFSTETLAITAVGCDTALVHCILFFWTISLLQFSIGLPPKVKKNSGHEDSKQSNIEELNSWYQAVKKLIERTDSNDTVNNAKPDENLKVISEQADVDGEVSPDVEQNNPTTRTPDVEQNNPTTRKFNFNVKIPKPKMSENQRSRYKLLYHAFRREIREALLAILLQELPFLVIRLYVLSILSTFETSVIFYSLKNLFVIGLHAYRFYAVHREYVKRQLSITPFLEGGTFHYPTFDAKSTETAKTAETLTPNATFQKDFEAFNV